MRDRPQVETMVEYIIKNMPDSLFEQLNERARKNRRSINNEMLVLIEQALQAEINERYDTQEMLAEARKIRQHLDLRRDPIPQFRRASRSL